MSSDIAVLKGSSDSLEKKPEVLSFESQGIFSPAHVFSSFPIHLHHTITTLNLKSNLFTYIPDEISLLCNLEVLKVAHNHVSRVPHWLSKLPALRELDLSNNDIFSVEMHLAAVPITSLDLKGNIISIIGVGSLPSSLTYLDLSFNKLCSVNLTYLSHLYDLRLNNNQLNELDNLPPNLTSCYVGYNEINTLNYKILFQKGLTLHFEAAFVDRSIEAIVSCWYSRDTMLDLSGLALTGISPLIGLCTHVEELDLGFNSLVSLPQELSSLTNLVKLDLCHNAITTLPLYLKQFTKLETLKLEGTLDHLVTPPKTIANDGIAQIMNYFNDLFLGEPSWRIKLMIVGSDRVGKTSILKCIKTRRKLKATAGNPSYPDFQASNIETLDIKEIKFFLESEKQTVTLSCWDFPGQEMYYAIHQMFFTRGSVYMVVWNLCQPEENQKVDFWLNSIRMRGDDLPIILVGTHMDKFLEYRKDEELDSLLRRVYKKYYHKYSLAGVVAMSCNTQLGIDGLMEALQRAINQVPELRTPHSSTHRQLEKLVVKLRTSERPPIMRWQEYSSVVNSRLKFHDSIHLKLATLSLVNMGFIIYFDDPTNDLDQWVILDPQWLIDVFSNVLTTKHKFIKDGIVSERDLPNLWRTPDSLGAPESLHSLLVTLMGRFEILFPLPPATHTYDTSSPMASSPDRVVDVSRSSPVALLTPPSSPSPDQGKAGNANGRMYLKTSDQREPSSRSVRAETRLGVSPPRVPSISGRVPITRRPTFVNPGSLSSSLPQIPMLPNTPTLPHAQPHNQNGTEEGLPIKRNSSMVEMFRVDSGEDLESMGKTQGKSMSADNITNPGPFIVSRLQKRKDNAEETKYLVPSQLPEMRPQFDLLWLPVDPAQYEYGRCFKVPMVPTGFFGHLMIRLLHTQLIALQPLLYWRYGFILTGTNARTSALVELVHSTSCIHVTVRSHTQLAAAHVLRLINETLRVLLTDWYKVEGTEMVPCPHCVTRGVTRPTLFNISSCEALAAKGVWFVECGSVKIQLDKFVPDVALNDFWGTVMPPRIAYDEISFLMQGEKKFFTIAPATVGGEKAVITLAPEDAWLYPDVVNTAVTLEQGAVATSPDAVRGQLDYEYSLKERKLIVGGFIWAGTPPIQAEFQLPVVLGRGGHGRIMKGTWHNMTVAIKHLEGEDPAVFNEFRRELWMMGGLNHPNILNLHAFTVSPLGMVLEHAEHGDLYPCLVDLAKKVLKIAHDVANGVSYLHSISPPILHRDLKTPNIMLMSLDETSPVCAKVGDFGLASRLFLNSLQYKLREFPVDNATWLAPEILREEEITLKSDVYAFGLILYELVTAKLPYSEFNYAMGLQQEDAVKNGVRPTLPHSLSQTPLGKEYVALVKECWDNEPTFRPTFEQILTRLDHMLAAAYGRQRGTTTTTTIVAPSSPAPTSPPATPTAACPPKPYTFASFYPDNPATPPTPPIISGFIRGTTPPASSSPTGSSPTERSDKVNTEPKPEGTVTTKGNAGVAREYVGALQMTIQIPTAETFVCIMSEGKRVWAGTSAGTIHVWNAENGKKLAHVAGAHIGTVQSLLRAGDYVWSVGDDTSLNLWSPDTVCTGEHEGTKSGYLYRKATRKFGKGWKKRWFVLDYFKKELVYYSKGEGPSGVIKGTIPLRNATTKNDGMERVKRSIRYIFTVTIGETDHTYDFATESEETRNDWVSTLNTVLEQGRPSRKWQLDAPSQALAKVDNTVWAALSPKILCIWDATDLVFLDKFFVDPRGPETNVIKTILQHDSMVYVAVSNFVVRINTKTHQQIDYLRGHLGNVNDVISVNANVWTCSEDKTMRIWSHATGACIQVIDCAGDRIRCMVLFNQLVWAGGTDAALKIWRARDYSVTATLPKHLRAPLRALTLVFQRTVWSASEDNTIVVWS